MTLAERFVKALQGEGPSKHSGPSPMWLYAKQRGCCFHCGQMMAPRSAPADTRGFTREHVLPQARGGRYVKNIVLAHAKCNQRRGDALPDGRDLFKVRMLYCPVNFDFAELARGMK